MGRGPAAALALLIAAIAAGPAAAAHVKVAGPTASGAVLRTYHERTALCVEVVSGYSHLGSSCGDPPRRPADTDLIDTSGYPGDTVVGGMAPPEIARVQIVHHDGATVDVPTRTVNTAPGLAFFLSDVDAAKHGEVRFVRLFDSSGTELAAVDGGDYEFQPMHSTTLGRVADLRAVAYDAREFEPSPIDLERVRRYLCVSLRFPGGSGELGQGCLSRETGSSEPLVATPMFGTCHHGNAVVAFATPDVARMQLVLGDGRRMTARSLRLPLGPPEGRRVLIAVAPPSAAVRRLEAFDAGGRRVVTQNLGIEPPAARCGSGELQFGLFAPREEGPERADAAPPGGTALVVRAEGERLCVGVDELPPAPTCFVPADEAVLLDAERDYADGSRGFAGLVDPHVAIITVRLADGRDVTVPTEPAPEAAGPYATVARAYAIHVDGSALYLRYRDAAGHTLDSQLVDAALGSLVQPHVALRAGATRLALGRFFGGATCGELLTTPAAAERAECERVDRRFATALVSCATHRIALYGRLGQTARAVEAITGAGRSVPGLVDRRSRTFLIVLKPHERLRALRVLGHSGYRAPLHLPAGTEQCGYGATLYGSL